MDVVEVAESPHQAAAGRRLSGAGLFALAAFLVAVLVMPAAVVSLLSPSSTKVDLTGQLDVERRLSLPPTEGGIELAFTPASAAPAVDGATMHGDGVYRISSCQAGCSVWLTSLRSEAELTLRITYAAADSEYLNDIELG